MARRNDGFRHFGRLRGDSFVYTLWSLRCRCFTVSKRTTRGVEFDKQVQMEIVQFESWCGWWRCVKFSGPSRPICIRRLCQAVLRHHRGFLHLEDMRAFSPSLNKILGRDFQVWTACLIEPSFGGESDPQMRRSDLQKTPPCSVTLLSSAYITNTVVTLNNTVQSNTHTIIFTRS